MAVSISGCAVGPNFSPPAAPDVNGYVPGKLASPDPGAGCTSRCRTALRHRRRRFGALVVGVQIPAAQRTGQAIGRPQSKSAGGGGRDQGRPIQRARPARIVLSASHRQFDVLQILIANPGQVPRDLRPGTADRILAGDQPADGVVRAGYLGRQLSRRREPGRGDGAATVPARGRLSGADQQCRDGRHSGGVAARPDRGDPAHHWRSSATCSIF